MKYILTLEKYKNTSQDLIDDMNLMIEFSDKFETKFEYRLDINDISNIETSVVGYGTKKYYSGLFINNTKYYKSKRPIQYTITLITNINPNGISSDDDIGRTFKIDLDTNSKIPDFHEYSRNIDEILRKFEEYVINTLNINQLSKKELKQKQLNKITKKFNL